MDIIYCTFIINILIISSVLLFLYNKKSKKNQTKLFKDLQIKDNYTNPESIDENTIAVISAAVAYYYIGTTKSVKICSIKKHFYADNRI